MMAIQLTLLIFITITTTLTIISAFSPTDHYLITTGPTTILDPNHRQFTSFKPSSSSLVVKDHNPDLNVSAIYHTARIFTKLSSYNFLIKESGYKMIRLHFRKFEFGILNGPCHDHFHVTANGYVLLFNFTSLSINSNSVVIKDFLIWVDGGVGKELVIKFLPVDESSYAFVNAVEVISAPNDLFVDTGNKPGYESLYRVNVGGVKITPFNDSLWRNWSPDDEWVKLSDVTSIKKVHFDGRIQYRVGGASREVGPDNVYNSARVLESVDGEVRNVNMTWVFPVKKGFKYLVRLHFCDIESISIGMIYFNVYVNGDLVNENFDLSMATSYLLASPFYADFVVDDERVLNGSIRVDIGPSSFSKAHAVDGILNGLEIWKMDNVMRSFDGEVCAGQLESKSQSGGQVSRLLSLSAAVCLLAIAFLVMRRKTEAKNAAGWSRVPSEIDLKSFNYPKSTGVSV